MLEPSFAVLSPEATCSLFKSCDPGIESELRNRVAKSGISGAFNDILRLTSDIFDIFTSLYFQSPLFNETCDHLSRRAKPGEKTVAVRALLESTSDKITSRLLVSSIEFCTISCQTNLIQNIDYKCSLESAAHSISMNYRFL